MSIKVRFKTSRVAYGFKTNRIKLSKPALLNNAFTFLTLQNFANLNDPDLCHDKELKIQNFNTATFHKFANHFGQFEGAPNASKNLPKIAGNVDVIAHFSLRFWSGARSEHPSLPSVPECKGRGRTTADLMGNACGAHVLCYITHVWL